MNTDILSKSLNTCRIFKGKRLEMTAKCVSSCVILIVTLFPYIAIRHHYILCE